ncbi:universal stress protein [Mycolicibacterium neoaurum]|uniref:universal stress protein n=1 Tax=Mycolicibacterium neoaurum TaxID=1795 RepID=UPI00248ADB8E|nr:universal stress protein [Mycolicibacterium neoaurum]WBP96365.1 universal stress protein [Mycolicibacterium neoaurum]WBS10104.1 universal stress protein [Mycolicibacterium neoaurum]
MTIPESPPVVVGIDGSKVAFRAAFWAAEEATSRDVPLRLVTVLAGGAEDPYKTVAKASAELSRIKAALQDYEPALEVECDVLAGDPGDVLAEASRSARLLCVGWKGTHNSGPGRRGSTASILARTAKSSVAIVHRRHAQHPVGPHRWVVAICDDRCDSTRLLQTAGAEARSRAASILALSPWPAESERTADIRAALAATADNGAAQGMVRCVLPRPDNIVDLLALSAQIDQLVIAWPDDPGLINQLLSSRSTDILRETDCTLLILRDAGHARTAGTSALPDVSDSGR